MAEPCKINMENSIQKRLVRNFVLVVILTVVILDSALVLGFKEYSYNGIKYNLERQLKASIETYHKYFLGLTLDELLMRDFEIIWSHYAGQIQLINPNKELVYDSIGAINDSVSSYEDIQKALKGQSSSRIGEVNYSDSAVISSSVPLFNDKGAVIGVLRFTSSLGPINSLIIKLTAYLVIITAFVTLIAAIFSHIFAKSIVRPILEIKNGAELMADGQYKKRIEIDNNDELGQVAGALNILSQEIVRKEQIKNDFISSISHELRTPLTSIKGWAVILKDIDEYDPILNKEGLQIIENEADRLSKMVEELLDFSRYISGRITLKKAEYDVRETCINIARQMHPRAKNEKISFRQDIENESVILIGDEDRIKQLLINLIDNAIKFSKEEGWVLLEGKKNREFYEILVSDNGVGMDLEEVSLVKEKFYKGKHSKSHSGLGLSIADEIAKLHNGSIDIISQKDVGTTIRVRLPLEKKDVK